MRALTLTFALFSLAALADDTPIEMFSDKGDLFIRAGAKSGLKVGSTVTVLGEKIGNTEERRRSGTAVVMEVWDSLSRIKLDEAAKADKSAKLVVLDVKSKDAAASGPAAKPSANPPQATPATEPGARGGLKGHASINGLGPLKRITLVNDNTFEWHGCDLRLPDNRRFRMGTLSAGDHNSISLPNFSQDGVKLDVPIDSMLVKCTEGEARLNFAM